MDTTRIPDTLGECVDMLEVIKEQKTGLRRQTEELDKYANMLKEELKKYMEDLGITECSGTNMHIKFVTKTKYSLKDKVLFCEYMRDRDAYDLMTCAVNQKAIQDRLEEGEEIPGLSSYDLITDSLTKRR